MTLILLSSSWIAGVLAGAARVPVLVFAVPALVCLILALLFPRKRKTNFLIFFCIFISGFGSLYYQLRLPEADESSVQFYNDKGRVELYGTIVGDPETTDNSFLLEVSTSSINLTQDKVGGKVLIVVPRVVTNTSFAYGDIVRVEGTLEKPRSIGTFDYAGYLAAKGIYSVVYSPGVDIFRNNRGFNFLALIYRLRESMSDSFAKSLPEPQASLAQGIILGLRGNIPASVENQFIRTGTAHILAISGVNLTITAGIIVSLGISVFGRRRQIYAWLALVTIWFYAVLSGFEPPVVRAAIMATAFLLADILGRQHNGVLALSATAAVMLAFSPRLVLDASFQLSTLAMAGMVFIAPPLQTFSESSLKTALSEKIFRFIRPAVESLIISLASIVALWPLLAYDFGIVSCTGPIATLLAAAPMPALIIAGSICGVAGIFLLPLAQFVGWFLWLILSYMLLIVRIADVVPAIEINSFTLQWALVYYGVIACTLLSLRYKAKLPALLGKLKSIHGIIPWRPVTYSLAVMSLLTISAAASMPDNRLHVDFLDVGQGDAILVSLGSQQILIDGGPGNEAILTELSRHMPFWDRTIDLVISTHPHADHLTGLIEVMDRYKVEKVMYADTGFNSTLNSQWKNLLDLKRVPIVRAQAGQTINFGDAVIQILNPPQPGFTGTDSDVDNNGIVSRISMGNISFLLTADTRVTVENRLLSLRSIPPSNVLKLAHHGSNTSSSAAFLSVISPDAVVISVGENNTFGHPDTNVLESLSGVINPSNLYRTDRQGTIEFITDGTRLFVTTNK